VSAARILAQAKVNLFLRILARETSGFHQIETLFCRIGLADEVVVRITPGNRSIRCVGDRLPPDGLGPDEGNLAWRAAAAYAEVAGWPDGFAIDVDKRIPVGGGLGGGSADAGAVLRALNALNPSPLPAQALLALAGSLGSDVPALTQDRSPLTLAWGHGEQMLALPPLPPRACWLFCPEVAVSTAEAYGWLAPTLRRPLPALASASELGDWRAVVRLAQNDFEDAVAGRIPLIARTLATLRSPGARELIGEGAMIELSGSGSSVFAIAGGQRPDQALPRWRVDEPGVMVLQTTTAERVEPVKLID
jgi:4-diphosphocytidyl-2-C-methyl-D-erythritol kinase